MPTTREKIREILASDQFSEGEKFVVRAQYRGAIPMGNFEEKLWELLCAADQDNLFQLSLAFPRAFRAYGLAVWSWRYGDLGDRLRKAGLDI